MLGPGLLAEPRPVDDHHVLLQNKLLHKNIVAFRNVDSRISIERSARRHAPYTRRRIAPLHREIASAAQLLADFDQMVLWSLQRGSYGVLLGMIGAQAGPQQTLNALIVLLHRRRIAAHDSPADA